MSQLVKKNENMLEILRFAAAGPSYPVVYVRFAGYAS